METIPVMVTDIPRRNSIQRRRGVRAIWFACSLSAFLLLSTITSAQVERQNPVTGPELARHNLAQVGASAEDIKVVLVKSPGLMVEVKRWVAKDATDQGQIITERDLADDAIFERLQNDVRFRSVVTQLLQHYGYLMPTVNPDSEAGKEQDLLIQERVKFIAQEEEQQRAQALQQAQDRYEKARKCITGGFQELRRGCATRTTGPTRATAAGARARRAADESERAAMVRPESAESVRATTSRQKQYAPTGPAHASRPIFRRSTFAAIIRKPTRLTGLTGRSAEEPGHQSLLQQLQSQNGGESPGASLGGSGLTGNSLGQYSGR